MALLNPYTSGRQNQNPMTRFSNQRQSRGMNRQYTQPMGLTNRPVNQQMMGQQPNPYMMPPMGFQQNQQMGLQNQQMGLQNQQMGFGQNQQAGLGQNKQGAPQGQLIDPSISYESLTEADMAIINKNKASASGENEPASPTSPTSPSSPANPANQKPENLEIFFNVSEALLGKIAQLVQNGHNGGIFYENLSQNATRESTRNQLFEIGQESKRLSADMSSIYHTFTGKDYEIKQAEIISEPDVFRGISLAIDEENRNLSDICDIYEEMIDERQHKKLNLMIYRKIRDINKLNMLLGK